MYCFTENNTQPEPEIALSFIKMYYLIDKIVLFVFQILWYYIYMIFQTEALQ